jgi:hypothetical protein
MVIVAGMEPVEEALGIGHAAVAQGDRGAEGLKQRQPDRDVARELRDAPAARLALLARLHERGHHHRQHLDDDRGGDVGHHAHGEDRQALQRAAREHVDHAENGVRLIVEVARHASGLMPGTGMKVPMR